MLKKILIGLGCTVLLLVVGIIALVGWVSHERSAYAATAVPYIKTVIPALTSWDLAQVESTMDPDVRKTMPEDKLKNLLVWLSTLGRLKGMDEPVFENVWSGASVGAGTMTLVTYTVRGHFDAGDGDITVRLRDRDGKFTVYYFSVRADALIAKPTKT